MVGTGVLGSKEVAGSVVRGIEVGEGFWIEELCNRDSRDNSKDKGSSTHIGGGREWEKDDGEGRGEDGRRVGEGRGR